MMIRLKLLMVAVGVAFVALGASANAQNFVVISSTAAGISVGQIVGATQEISIPTAKKVVMVNEKGKTATLKGPFKGTVGGEAGGEKSRALTVLASLVRTTQRDTKSVGAIRAAGIRSEDQAMMVNLSETGDYCLVDDNPPTLTRYKTETAETVELVATRGGKAVTIPWPKNTLVMDWPAEIDSKDGDVLLGRLGNEKSRKMIRLHRMGDKYPNRIEMVLAMAEKECLEQARMMLALIRNSAG